MNHYRTKSDKTHTDLIDDLNSKQDELRQARIQMDRLVSTRTQLEQAQDQNQRFERLKKEKSTDWKIFFF